MIKRKHAIAIYVISLIISIAFILIGLLVPDITNAHLYTDENTFMHTATVEYTAVNKNTDNLDIHIKENDQTLIIGMDWLKNKSEFELINNGDIITFWTHDSDTYNLPNVDIVTICAFSINNKPIVTIEERNHTYKKMMIIVRTICIVIVIIMELIGAFLLGRTLKKPKDKSNQNPQT